MWPMVFPTKPTTGAQWRVIAWCLIVGCLAVGVFCLVIAWWVAPEQPRKPEPVLMLRSCAFLFIALAAAVFAVEEAIERWL